MFQIQLSCDSCEFSTAPFVGAYVPDSDSVSVVFQDEGTKNIRVVEFIQISESLSERSTESELDEKINALCDAEIQASEKRINTWVVPDEFSPLQCPCCQKKAVSLRLLSMF